MRAAVLLALARADAGDRDAWIDRAQLGRMVAAARTAFEKELTEQQRAM